MADEAAADPLRLFASTNPVDERSLVPTQHYGPAEALLADLLGGQGAAVTLLASPRERRRRRFVVAGAAAVLTCSAAAAWITALSAENPLEVACYAQPALEGEVAGVTPAEANPVEACAHVWRTGAFAGRGPVPPLVGCVSQEGTAAIFPAVSSAFCETLGLDRLGESPASDQAILGLQQTLTEEFLARGCVPPEVAVSLIRSELDSRGLGGWRINNPGPFTASRPCASLSFDPSASVIALVPFPARPPSPATTAPTGGPRP